MHFDTAPESSLRSDGQNGRGSGAPQYRAEGAGALGQGYLQAIARSL
ncbi:hypothetical protein SAMN06295912_104189 [Sphingomonas laterariae]|uniref:Uncharacterized protein n=1 Tax=Edaphosphingomonas laterariae TaxID=861865 RepID=A0A239DNA8_9SPHN|nr:hypothetical protein SAMN06295912_104189 [Sphingomonas laterariae]